MHKYELAQYAFTLFRELKQIQLTSIFGFPTDYLPLVNRGEGGLCSPANIKEANKDFKTYVERSTTVQNLLFLAHSLCLSYVIKTFLL